MINPSEIFEPEQPAEPKRLPASASDLIQSVAVDQLLAQRDAAVAQLRVIAGAVAGYFDIGNSLWPPTEEYQRRAATNAPYAFREPVDQRPSGRGAYLHDKKWLDEGIKSVDAAIWDHLLTKSGLWTFFDSKAREEWRKQIDERKTPALNADNIRATFEMLYAQRGEFFERGVVELFHSLSWDYKRNLPIKFGKRIIMRGVVGPDGWPGSYSRSDKLDDLDRAFHVLDGKPEPDHRSSIKQQLCNRQPKHAPLETPYLKLKTFQNGNGHVEFLRPALVDELNMILAKHHPHALARAESADAA